MPQFIKEINKEARQLQKILEQAKEDGEILEFVRRKDVLQRQLRDATNIRLTSSTANDVNDFEVSMGYRPHRHNNAWKSNHAFAKRALVRSLTTDLAHLELITRWWIIAMKEAISVVSYVGGAISYLVKLTIRLIFSDSWRFILKVILTGKID